MAGYINRSKSLTALHSRTNPILLSSTQVLYSYDQQDSTTPHLNPLIQPTMKLTPILTLLALTTAATATHLPYPNPSTQLEPHNHTICHHVGSLTEFVKALPDVTAMTQALQGLNKVHKVNKWLKCHRENRGAEEDACDKTKEIKKWFESYWTAPAQEWVERKKSLQDECVELGAVLGCPAPKGRSEA